MFLTWSFGKCPCHLGRFRPFGLLQMCILVRHHCWYLTNIYRTITWMMKVSIFISRAQNEVKVLYDIIYKRHKDCTKLSLASILILWNMGTHIIFNSEPMKSVRSLLLLNILINRVQNGFKTPVAYNYFLVHINIVLFLLDILHTNIISLIFLGFWSTYYWAGYFHNKLFSCELLAYRIYSLAHI